MSFIGDVVPLPTPTEEPKRVQTAVDIELYGADALAPTDMFPVETALRETFRTRVDEVSDVLGLSHAQTIARHRDFVGGVVRPAGLDKNPELAALLYQEVTDAEIAAARSRGDDDDLEARVGADAETARKALRELYGRERAEEILKRTRAFVDQHPKLKALVNKRGIGSKPAVVLALADHVRKVTGPV